MLLTNRLIIRKFNIDDIEALFSILSDKDVNKYLPWFPFENLEYTKKHLENFYLNTNNIRTFYRYAVCLKENNNDNNDFGYALKKDNIKYITATHDINNIASYEVMKKIGMIYKYSYEELWQPKNFLVIFRMYQLNLDENNERVYKGYSSKYINCFIENIF
ncbi:GNAT family N-acetyltransferase [uncultured Brachyspira sp.]|uniref:GNAT family N-acetyltransferase n=1 Tax=uncultured Brachyspira sp. TaxID=221953 RepID=UPI002605641E|nr:GNAT family N-acetyltransferase [uncultured Brachyspira sp.]